MSTLIRIALFALALRAYLDRQPLGDGLFGLLGDARLGRALRAMLERPFPLFWRRLSRWTMWALVMSQISRYFGTSLSGLRRASAMLLWVPLGLENPPS